MSQQLPPGPSIAEIVFKLPLFYKNDIAYYEYFLQKYGDMVFMRLGEFEILLANHPEAIKHVLKTNYENYSRQRAIRELEPLLKDGIFYLEDEEWKKELSLLKPGFHQSSIDLTETIVRQETQKSFELLQKSADSQKPLELSSFLRHLFLSILIKTQCSPEAEIDQNRMLKNLQTILDGVRPGLFYKRVLHKQLKKTFKISSDNDAFNKAAQDIEDVMMSLFYDAESGKIPAAGILHILVNAYREKRISLQTVRGEMRNLVFAGMDTIADSMTWFLNNLMMHPQVQEKCRKEITDANTGEILGYREVESLEYLNASLKESLRINPSVWAIHRMSLKDDEIMGYRIPRGVWIFMSPYFLHRNKNHWDSPEQFQPERFLNNKIENPYQYIPFGQGPHYCLGSRIAQLQISQVTGSMLKKFRFTRADKNEVKFVAGVMMHPANGLYANITLV